MYDCQGSAKQKSSSTAPGTVAHPPTLKLNIGGWTNTDHSLMAYPETALRLQSPFLSMKSYKYQCMNITLT